MAAVDTLSRVKRERFAFIDVMLGVYGSIQRAPLIDFFEVGPASASRILAEYRDLFPKNVAYDPSSKKYVKIPDTFEYRAATRLSGVD